MTLLVNNDFVKPNFFAVASNPQYARTPQFANLKWISLKTCSVRFSNIKQVHFDSKEAAKDLYDFIDSQNKLVFKNW